MSAIRVGTCSWADKSMISAWYPRQKSTPEARLRYYASHFDTVEVDSSFYALPSSRNSSLWAARTPDGFRFHVKAFGLMTGHSVSGDRLPPGLRDYHYELTRYGNVKSPPPEMIRASFEMFKEGIEPLRQEGRLGSILLQFPPYFTARTPAHLRRNLAYILACRRQLSDYDVVVEFRHRSWLATHRDQVLSFLRDNCLGYVCVDAPPVESDDVAPTVVDATTTTGYVRFHGRNTDTWSKKTKTAAERFKYLYSEDELREWVDPVKALSSRVKDVYVMFNNCYADYAPRNALEFRNLLS